VVSRSRDATLRLPTITSSMYAWRRSWKGRWNSLKPNGSRSNAGFKPSWGGKGNSTHKRKEDNESDEQIYEQTEKASSQAFTQAGKHRAVPFAICDVALLDAVLCG